MKSSVDPKQGRGRFLMERSNDVLSDKRDEWKFGRQNSTRLGSIRSYCSFVRRAPFQRQAVDLFATDRP